MRISTALLLLSTTAAGEVQFNCPWCQTRLALPEADFARERAVLCPRCNNPVDLAVQRRTRAAVPAAPLSAAAGRSVMVPPRSAVGDVHDKAERGNAAHAAPGAAPHRTEARPGESKPHRTEARPGESAPPAGPDTRALPPLEKKKQENVALNFEDNKPIDIDAAFRGEPIHVDDIDSLMSRSDLWAMGGPRRSVTGGAGASKPGAVSGVVHCPACNYENAPIPPGFEFGNVRKCTWCGKPLPQ